MIEKTAKDSILLSYNGQSNYIHMKYLKSSKSEEYRNVWECALDIAEEYQCNLWLIDQKKQNIHPDDQKWVINDWFPRSVQRAPFSVENPRRIALVESENFFVQFSTEKFVKENSAPGFITNVFPNTDLAETWLLR